MDERELDIVCIDGVLSINGQGGLPCSHCEKAIERYIRQSTAVAYATASTLSVDEQTTALRTQHEREVGDAYEAGLKMAKAMTNKALTERVRVLTEALEQYADKANWYGRQQENMWDIYWAGSNADGYDIAQNALTTPTNAETLKYCRNCHGNKGWGSGIHWRRCATCNGTGLPPTNAETTEEGKDGSRNN